MTHARIVKRIPPRFSLDVEIPLAAGVSALYGPSGAANPHPRTIAGFARPIPARILLR